MAACLALLAPLVAAQDVDPAGEQYSEIAPLAVRSLLLDGAAVAGRLVAVGERGHILISSDGGSTWEQAQVPTRATLTGVWFTDGDHGWVVGHDETILRSNDGGRVWETVHEAPENLWPLLGVWFRDTSHGIAVGAYSRYLVTDDGGSTWREQPFEPRPAKAPDEGSGDSGVVVDSGEPLDDDEWAEEDDLGFDVHLNRIIPAGDRLYIPAEAGQIFRSDDGGESWLRLPSPYEGSFYGALPLEGDSLLIFGLRGHLFRSDDAGLNWTAVDTGTEAMLTDGLMTREGTIVVVGLAGVVIVSRDGGHSFVLDQQADRKGFSRILPADGGFVLLGESGARRYELPPAAVGADGSGQ